MGDSVRDLVGESDRETVGDLVGDAVGEIWLVSPSGTPC